MARRPSPDRRARAHASSPVVAVERVRFLPDDDGRGGVTVLIDGVPSSHLDPADPTRLDFEYMRWMGDALDVLLPPGPTTAVHLGAAACTLARYIEATREGSRQVAVEYDEEVLRACRERFGLRSTGRLRLRQGDAREALASLVEIRPHGYDVVIRDAFSDAQVPHHLTTVEFADLVASSLSGQGLYLANIGDAPGLPRARREAATVARVLGPVLLLAEPAQFKGGRRHGNVVLLAGPAVTDDARLAELARRLAAGAVRARLLSAADAAGLAAGSRVLRDADDASAPPLPPAVDGR